MESEECVAAFAAAPKIKEVLDSYYYPNDDGPPKKATREASQVYLSKANHSSRQHQSSFSVMDSETEEHSETASLVTTTALELLYRRILDKLQRFEDNAQKPNVHFASPSSSLDDQGIVQAVVSERNDEASVDEPKQQPRAYTTMHKDESLPLRSSSNTTNYFQWQIQLDATTWRDYDYNINTLIEESFHNGKPYVDLPNSDEMIHFESCRQINKCRIHESQPSTASRIRVRRVQVTHYCREDTSMEKGSSSHGKERQETFEEETEAFLGGILAEIAMALEQARKTGPGSANGDEERNLDTTELEVIPELPPAISDRGELVKEDLERRDDDFGLTIMQTQEEEVSIRVTAASVISNASFDDSTNCDLNENNGTNEQGKSLAISDQEDSLHLKTEECCIVKNTDESTTSAEKTEEKDGLLDSFDRNSRLPIHRASYNGDLETVRSCLDQGDHIEATDKYGHAPLHCACIYGHLDVVELLLERGAEIGSASIDTKYTPLHYASCLGHSNVVALLLDKGANMDATSDYKHFTPLHYASYNGHLETVRLLLDRGASINVTSDYKDAPLHYACYNGHLEVARLLLERGADMEAASDYKGFTPLCYACYNGHFKVVRLLLDIGADQTVLDKSGQSPLHIASTKGHQDIATLLERHGKGTTWA